MFPERKRKAAKKRGYDVRTDSRLRHNNSTRSIPAHIRSYDNNGRSGAVTPSNTEPQQKTRLQVIHYIGTRNGHSKESDQYDRTPIFFAKTIEMSLHIPPAAYPLRQNSRSGSKYIDRSSRDPQQKTRPTRPIFSLHPRSAPSCAEQEQENMHGKSYFPLFDSIFGKKPVITPNRGNSVLT